TSMNFLKDLLKRINPRHLMNLTLRQRLIFISVGFTVISSCVFLGVVARMFVRDKTAYIYDTFSFTAKSLKNELADETKGIKKDTEPIMALYDWKTGRFDPTAPALLNELPRILMLRVFVTGTDQKYASVGGLARGKTLPSFSEGGQRLQKALT